MLMKQSINTLLIGLCVWKGTYPPKRDSRNGSLPENTNTANELKIRVKFTMKLHQPSDPVSVGWMDGCCLNDCRFA